MLLALVTLVLGAILGYLAQRSRMCFVGGWRDFILVRDTELLKGVLAFFVTAWLGLFDRWCLRFGELGFRHATPVASPSK